MNVVCISGKAQHGKDTTAGIIKELLEEQGEKVLVAHYGDLVKYICRTFFNWNGEKDAAGRHLLQYVGTDVIRKKYPDYWVDFVAEMLELFNGEWDWVLIPDTRFPNEVEVMKEKFRATHLRVIRQNFISPLTEEQQRHPSETEPDDYYADWFLFNDGTIDNLKTAVNTWFKEIYYAD